MLSSKSWLKNFVKEVENELCLPLKSQKNRFPSQDRLLRKFRELISHLLDSENNQSSEEVERQLFKELIEKHNELCVAYQILFQQNEPRCIKLEYEPETYSTEKRIDFHVVFDSENARWIEVKTIHPEDAADQKRTDDEMKTGKEINKSKIKETNGREEKDWLQYQKSQQYFPLRTELILSRKTDGANIWHDKFAARSRMLEYSWEFEKRINESLIGVNDVCVLALVGNGYDWRLNELEDFVTFYHTGKHLPGDIFQKMESYTIQKENIKLSKRINQFAYFKRGETSVKPDLVIWSVQPPRWTIAEG